jgi:hypothetical protein
MQVNGTYLQLVQGQMKYTYREGTVCSIKRVYNRLLKYQDKNTLVVAHYIHNNDGGTSFVSFHSCCN